jgi:hypothetical protein
MFPCFLAAHEAAVHRPRRVYYHVSICILLRISCLTGWAADSEINALPYFLKEHLCHQLNTQVDMTFLHI